MRPAHTEIFTALRQRGGVLLRREVPELEGQLDWLTRRGALVQALPGTYLLPGAAEDPMMRMLAARRWAPDGILRGAAAARVTYHPQTPIGDVGYSVRTRQVRRSGYHLDRRHVPPDLVLERGPWRSTVPALTVLDLSASQGGDAIDTALRSRRVTVDQLRDALTATPGRPGNRERLQLVIESRSAPWSAAERLAHRVLHGAGISGWVANHPIEVAGMRYYLDIAFCDRRLVVEVDGREFHGPDRFEQDRARDNEIVAAGWTVLHVTWTMLNDPAVFLRLLEQTLGTCPR